MSGYNNELLCYVPSERVLRECTDGVGAAARFWSPQGLCCTPEGELVVADTLNHSLRLALASHTAQQR